MDYIIFTIIGYLSGSIMYAYWLPKLICGENITVNSSDGNPGTANAYKNGGFFIGTLVLICELLKGFLPVYLAGEDHRDEIPALYTGADRPGTRTRISFFTHKKRRQSYRRLFWRTAGALPALAACGSPRGNVPFVFPDPRDQPAFVPVSFYIFYLCSLKLPDLPHLLRPAWMHPPCGYCYFKASGQI